MKKCGDCKSYMKCPVFPDCDFAERCVMYESKEKDKMTKVERHKELCLMLNEIYEKKNHDYGDSFHTTFMEEGFAMSRIRLTDKLNRFKALTLKKGQKVSDESLTDTLMDLANYSIMTVLEINEQNNM